jgi:16S rRNA U516 pseudouridylate synthase RsuA-like enzyme
MLPSMTAPVTPAISVCYCLQAAASETAFVPPPHDLSFTRVIQPWQSQTVRSLFDVFGLKIDRMIRSELGPYKLGELPRGSALQVPLHESLKPLLSVV